MRKLSTGMLVLLTACASEAQHDPPPPQVERLAAVHAALRRALLAVEGAAPMVSRS